MKRGTGGVKRLNMYGRGGGKVDMKEKSEGECQMWTQTEVDCCRLDLK